MDISAFSSYLLLCEEMNYAAAARRCFMTRQALRQTVQALEKHYSVTLVENRMNRLYLTEAGEQLRRQAERIVAEMNRTESVMEAYACANRRLRIGFSASMLPYYAPDLLVPFQQFAAVQKDLQVDLAVMETDTIIEQLECGKLDAGVVVDTGRFTESLDRIEIRRHTLMITGDPSDPCLQKEQVTFEDLDGRVLQIMSSADTCFRVFKSEAEKRNVHIRFVITGQMVDALERCRKNHLLMIDRSESGDESLPFWSVSRSFEQERFSLYCALLTRPVREEGILRLQQSVQQWLRDEEV